MELAATFKFMKNIYDVRKKVLSLRGQENKGGQSVEKFLIKIQALVLEAFKRFFNK